MHEEQITRGIAVLDEHSRYGAGWVFHVDTDALSMSDWTRCVLGQLYGEFYSAVEQLIVRLDTTPTNLAFTITHGFELDPSTEATKSIEDYEVLTVEWRAHITELRFQRRALLDGDATSEVNTQKEEVNEHE